MPAVHLVERLDRVRRIDRDRMEWESGYWAMPEETAKQLVGGDLYLHRAQSEASHFGGKILSYHVEPSGPEVGKIVFQIQFGLAYRGVKAGRGGWGNEKKFVW
jgi:hypothetical protein